MWTMKINKQHNQGIGQNQEWIKAAGGDSQPAPPPPPAALQ